VRTFAIKINKPTRISMALHIGNKIKRKIGDGIAWIYIPLVTCCLCLLLSCSDGKKTSFKDIQITWATDFSEDGLDFLLNNDSSYYYPDSTLVLKDDMHLYALSDAEYSLAKDVLKHYFDNHLYDKDNYMSEEPYRFRKYFRQYIGYKMRDSLYAYVNLYTHFPSIPEPECLCTISPSKNVLVYEDNGGRNFATAVISLDKKRVVYFKLSKADPNYVSGHFSEKELNALFPSLSE